jgi:hypothetical protein
MGFAEIISGVQHAQRARQKRGDSCCFPVRPELKFFHRTQFYLIFGKGW